MAVEEEAEEELDDSHLQNSQAHFTQTLYSVLEDFVVRLVRLLD